VAEIGNGEGVLIDMTNPAPIAIIAIISLTALLCPFCGQKDTGNIPEKETEKTWEEKIPGKANIPKTEQGPGEKRKSPGQKPKNLHDSWRI
jgi:hypothetical protein